MQKHGLRKRLIVYLLLWFSFGGQVLLAQEKIVVLERMTLDENFRLHSLDVDRAGALYFGSFEEIVKLRPDGRRVFQINARDHGLKMFSDFRVSPTGELIAMGVIEDPQISSAETRVLVFSSEGKLLQSLEVSGVAGQRVEPGENGEVFLLGLKQEPSPHNPEIRTVVYRLNRQGEVLAQIAGTELNLAGQALSRNNRGMAVTKKGLFLMDPASPDVLLHRFSFGGQKLETKSFLAATAKGRANSAPRHVESTFDYFSSLNSDHFVVAQLSIGDQWQERTVGEGKRQATARYRPFSHIIQVISWDGTVYPIPVENMGLLRAVGRDGLLYFVKTVTMAGRTRTEVVKATLK
ncbi:MAG: hypothetical protein RML74_05945 [Acidobacteriota bacterium]|nr:hypothetical protein [Acidobacteriota bacterium]